MMNVFLISKELLTVQVLVKLSCT